jgi:hypothetical protein
VQFIQNQHRASEPNNLIFRRLRKQKEGAGVCDFGGQPIARPRVFAASPFDGADFVNVGGCGGPKSSHIFFR